MGASCVGPLTQRSLKSLKSRALGEVIAVFPTTFYVKTTDHELLLVTSRQLTSPITVNLRCKGNFHQVIKPQDEVSLLEGEIRVGESISIDLSHAMSSGRMQIPQVGELALTKETLFFCSLILAVIDNRLSVLDPAALAHGGASRFVSGGILPFRESNDVDDLSNAAKEIVGLGTGFTPSGDDLVGGFLASYNALAHIIHRPIIYLNFHLLESRTSWLSAKLLDYMQRLMLDNQVGTLLESVASHDDDTFIVMLETLLPRGHTSGIDMLVGMTLGLALVQDFLRDDEVARNVAKRLGLLS
jgi:hypothetical protein